MLPAVSESLMATHYLHLNEDDSLPDLAFEKPYKCVVILNERVSFECRTLVSKWLVETGCLYMMAWGANCGDWDDSVDWANIEQFESGDIPEAEFVMTTWHEDESLEEVFWFCNFCAHAYNDQDFPNTLILDIGNSDRKLDIIKRYEEAGSKNG